MIPFWWSSGRASALRLGGCGFDPRPGRSKDCINSTCWLPAWQSVFGDVLTVKTVTLTFFFFFLNEANIVKCVNELHQQFERKAEKAARKENRNIQ